MKYFLAIIITGLVLFSCKSSKETGNVQTEATPEMENHTTGIVSHKFRPDGCPTVIIVSEKESGDSIILIPKDKLGEFDQDGLMIMFQYQPLKMPNPEGCKQGVPAEIRNITKK